VFCSFFYFSTEFSLRSGKYHPIQGHPSSCAIYSPSTFSPVSSLQGPTSLLSSCSFFPASRVVTVSPSPPNASGSHFFSDFYFELIDTFSGFKIGVLVLPFSFLFFVQHLTRSQAHVPSVAATESIVVLLSQFATFFLTFTS